MVAKDQYLTSALKRARDRRWYAAHRTIALAKDRLYRAEHREQARANTKKYRATHNEAVRAYSKEYGITHRQENNARQNARRKQNPENYHAQGARYRARKRVVATLTASQWKAIVAAYKGRCAYCGAKPKQLTMDHVIPLSRHGTHTADNVVPACRSCNSRKSTKPPIHPPMLRLLL